MHVQGPLHRLFLNDDVEKKFEEQTSVIDDKFKEYELSFQPVKNKGTNSNTRALCLL